MSVRSVASCALLLGLAGAAATPAGATLLVPLRDAALVDQAALVVVAEVEAVLPRTDERPATDYLVRVERALKGEAGASTVVVRVPGGRDAAGRELVLFGAPRFAAGERALLFLGPEREDGTRRILHFVQGAFHAARAGERTAAVRDYSEVQVASRSEAAAAPRVRDFERFADWIADRARGLRRFRDYLFRPEPAVLGTLTREFTYFEEDGLNYRWFQFDTGNPVPWRAHESGQPGLPGGGFAEFQRALAAWNDEPATPIRLTYAGTTTASAGFDRFDGQNVILWNDPNGDIEGTFSCSQGGTLAVGGPWSDSGVTGRFDGKTYIRIQGADIIFNDGIDCRFARSPDASEMVEEVAAHELGHSLGLGHSSENEDETNPVLLDALMYYRAHDDRRGARLASDDLAGIRGLYARAASGGGGSGSCPAGHLCLLKGRFRVSVTWRNQHSGATGVGGAIADTDLAGFFYFTDKNNVELIVKILDFGSEIKVFYSQLTDFEFEMTVLDTATGQSKVYRNTPGNCGDIDHAAFQIAAPPAGDLLGEAATVTAEAGSCRADADTLCLLDNRFALEVAWRNHYSGQTGIGTPRRLSNLTGAFWFTQPANLEILVKTLDFGDRILVIYGSLSDFEYSIRVTDTTTGAVEVYANPAGNFCGGLDADAF